MFDCRRIFAGLVVVVVIVVVVAIQVNGSVIRQGKDDLYRKLTLDKLDYGQSKNPGFKARITQKGLDFAKAEGLLVLNQRIKDVHIPDLHDNTHVSLLGHVYYDITNIHLTSFSIPSSKARLTPNQAAGGVTLSASWLYMAMHANWHYKKKSFPSLSDSGSCDATASSVSLSATIRIGADSSGSPSVSALSSDCACSIGKLDIKFHGGASWLYNLISDYFEGEMKKSLVSQICETVTDFVNNDLRNGAKTVKMVAPVFDDVAEIDYSLVGDPVFTRSIESEHKGEIYLPGSETECPVPSPPIPPDSDTSRMVSLWITEYLPNSAGYTLQEVGYLQYNLTADDSSSFSDDLNTSKFAFKYLIPQIAFLYFDMPMEIHVTSTQAPVVSIQPDGVQAVFVGHAAAFAVQSDNDLAHLFTLALTVTADFSMEFHQDNIQWTVPTFSSELSLVHSDVGPVLTPALQAEMDLWIKWSFLPRLNAQGSSGTPLPTLDGYQSSNPVVTLGQGFLKISTDLARKKQ